MRRDRPPLRRSCLLAAALLAPALACSREAPPPRGPDVVLVTLESLRPDSVGAYGGASPGRPEVPITPHLDAFAAGATVYEDASSVTSWTLAAHASLFTGLYPSGHQATGPLDRLDDSYPTLAEALAARGWQTAGVVSGPYLRRTHNLSQGFERYEQDASSITSRLAHADVTNPAMLASLERVLDERDPHRPLFLFAYFWDPHFDYLPPPPWSEAFVPPGAEPFDAHDLDANPEIYPGMDAHRLAWLRSQYAGEIRWTDEHLGRFFELLRRDGIWDDALVIVTADHGEAFFEHGGKGHKNDLFAEEVRVPLIVKYPGQREGRRDARLASLVDVLPTVLEAAGIAPEFPVHGRSLRAPDDPARAVLYELETSTYANAPGGPLRAARWLWRAIRRGEWRLVEWRGDPASGGSGRRLFRIASDPAEQTDLADAEPARREELARELAAGIEAARADAGRYVRGGEARLEPEEVERLRALGYFEK